jgi:hypothetical protein
MDGSNLSDNFPGLQPVKTDIIPEHIRLLNICQVIQANNLTPKNSFFGFSRTSIQLWPIDDNYGLHLAWIPQWSW